MDADDPFDAVVLSTGLEIDLHGGERSVHGAVGQSLLIEGTLFDRGITCELKDNGQDCLTCSQYTADPVERLARLCRLGRDQQTLVKRAQALAEARLAPYQEMAAASERFMEMDDRYAELFASGV